MFGFFKGKKAEKPQEEEEELEPVRFLGALNGVDPNLSANARLVDAALVRAKDVVTDALARRADTLRLDPKGDKIGVGLSIDGIPYPGGSLSKAEGLAITQMLKLLAGLDIKQRKAEQQGGIKAEFQQKAYELMVSITPVPEGERLTLRSHDLTVKLETPAEIGMSNEQRKKIRELCSGKGVFIACGPPGSGTTTTMWAVATGLDAFIYTIFTLGETGGRKLHNITPFEKNPGDNLLTSITRATRKEADVLILDPLQDADSARQVFQKSGDTMMISEMPAKDIPSAIQRLIEWVGDPAVVAQGLRGLVTQKLIRKLCSACKQAYRPNPEFLARAGLPDGASALYRPPQRPNDPQEELDYVPCDKCGEMGYLGRTGMFEFLEMSEGVRRVIVEKGKDPTFATALRQVTRDEKQPTLQQDGLRLVAEGTTSLEELQRAFRPPAGAGTSSAARPAVSKSSGTQRAVAPGAKPGSAPSGGARPPQGKQPPKPPPAKPK